MTGFKSPLEQALETAWEIEVRMCERHGIPIPNRAHFETAFRDNSEVMAKRIDMTAELISVVKSTGLDDKNAVICLRRAAELILEP